jgi:hypothetical protein
MICRCFNSFLQSPVRTVHTHQTNDVEIRTPKLARVFSKQQGQHKLLQRRKTFGIVGSTLLGVDFTSEQ